MHLVSVDPATGDEVGRVSRAGTATVDEAFEEARHAAVAWSVTPWKTRAALLAKWRRIVSQKRAEISRLVTLESGKPLAEALMADVLPALEFAKHLERMGEASLQPRAVRLHNPLLWGRRSVIHREPVGVVGVISPWNYPLCIPATGILTALMAGNGVVLKPAPQTPLTGQWLVDSLQEAGFPAGIAMVVHGEGDVGRAVVERSDAVIFTGSVPTGRSVEATCGKRAIPVCLELGGKDPMIIMPGRRREGTHGAAVWAAFTNAGQTCASVERLYVQAKELPDTQDDLVARAMELRVGHGLGPVDMGPLIDDHAVKWVMAHIKDAEKRGAEILCGGEILDDGPRFIAPTVLGGVDHDMQCMTEETFGPTLPIMGYGSTDDAVTLANDTTYGLTASVWGDGAEGVASRLQAGTVMIDECLYTYAAPETPWSGWKDSGPGVSHGPDPFDAVTHVRHIHQAKGKPDPWHYPYDEDLTAFLEGGIDFLHEGSLRGGIQALRRR